MVVQISSAGERSVGGCAGEPVPGQDSDGDSDSGVEVEEPEPEPLSAEQQAREAALGRAGAYREAGNEAFKRCVWAGGGRTERHSRTH